MAELPLKDIYADFQTQMELKSREIADLRASLLAKELEMSKIQFQRTKTQEASQTSHYLLALQQNCKNLEAKVGSLLEKLKDKEKELISTCTRLLKAETDAGILQAEVLGL